MALSRQRILSPLCLPFHHTGLLGKGVFRLCWRAGMNPPATRGRRGAGDRTAAHGAQFMGVRGSRNRGVPGRSGRTGAPALQVELPLRPPLQVGVVVSVRVFPPAGLEQVRPAVHRIIGPCHARRHGSLPPRGGPVSVGREPAPPSRRASAFRPSLRSSPGTPWPPIRPRRGPRKAWTQSPTPRSSTDCPSPASCPRTSPRPPPSQGGACRPWLNLKKQRVIPHGTPPGMTEYFPPRRICPATAIAR